MTSTTTRRSRSTMYRDRVSASSSPRFLRFLLVCMYLTSTVAKTQKSPPDSPPDSIPSSIHLRTERIVMCTCSDNYYSCDDKGGVFLIMDDYPHCTLYVVHHHFLIVQSHHRYYVPALLIKRSVFHTYCRCSVIYWHNTVFSICHSLGAVCCVIFAFNAQRFHTCTPGLS